VSLLESAGPAVVVELRQIPRFDIGPLNRQSIFDLFRQKGDVYLDFGTGEFEGSNTDDLPLRVQKTLQRYVEQQRPFLFLTSAAQEPPSFSKSILKWLRGSKEPWEIYEVPHHGSKWASEFIAQRALRHHGGALADRGRASRTVQCACRGRDLAWVASFFWIEVTRQRLGGLSRQKAGFYPLPMVSSNTDDRRDCSTALTFRNKK
jgi:hypothetical protein